MSLELALGIALFGGFGAALRYVVDTLLRERRHWSAPGTIMLINVLGSFGLGVTVAMALAGPWPSWLAVGFFGGFTTFSAVMVDVLELAQSGRGWRATWFALGQLAIAAIFVLAGLLMFVIPPGMN